jgi:hypothetical protein
MMPTLLSLSGHFAYIFWRHVTHIRLFFPFFIFPTHMKIFGLASSNQSALFNRGWCLQPTGSTLLSTPSWVIIILAEQVALELPDQYLRYCPLGQLTNQGMLFFVFES